MRKDSKNIQSVNVASVQGYHTVRNTSGNPDFYGSRCSCNYAFNGFSGNWYFNSDRKEQTRFDDSGILVRANGQPLAGYGLEIETQCNSITSDTVLAEVFSKIIMPKFKFGADMFKMQQDGSLGGRTSVEVITQIMTKLRIRNDYAAYKTMFDVYFPAFNISANSFSTSCGMHVNISNALFGKTKEAQFEAIRKLHYLINRHYDFFTRALYRDPEKTTYCGRMTEEHLEREEYSRSVAAEYKWENARNITFCNPPSTHYNCLNLSHVTEGRVEIRLVGGQKDFQTFRNTMETVFFMVDRVKTIKWEDLDNLGKFFKGCNQYVYKRIRSECRELISREQLVEIYDNVKTEDLELN